jgi:flagellar hook-basal body complex protein FliE
MPMPNSINGLGIPLPPAAPQLSPGGADSLSSAESPLFGKMLLKSLGEVNGLEQSAQVAVEKSFAGDDVTQVEALTSMKKADLALRLMVQIRNKVMEAYTEIKQMQL